MENFDCNGDGSWITDGICKKTLVIVHDDSYIKEVDPNVCSAAYMIYCTLTCQQAKGTVMERSNSVDNYRAEILGGVMTQLVLRAATQNPVTTTSCTAATVDCDNKGVVLHGNSSWWALKEK